LEEPHECTVVRKPCTIGRKFWFSDIGGGVVAGIGGREKKKAEARLRACGALGPHEEISGAVEAVSFDDTMGELRKVFEEGLSEDRTVPVCSKRMYEVIAEFGRGLGSGRTARVNTKYKTMDRKVRPVAAPLPEGSGLRMKEVASDPSLRDPAGIGQRFTDDTLRELKVGGGGFLLPAEEDRFRRMLGRHGKAFAFSPKEIGCVDPTIVEPMVIFTVPHVPWNLKPIPVPMAHMLAG
jgi:hypothetical protein